MKILFAFILIFSLSYQIMAQCSKDIECKGDRVCINGRCQEPLKQKPPCTRDVDCQGDSVCDHGKCVATNPKSSSLSNAPATAPAPAPAPTLTPGNAPSSKTTAVVISEGSTEPSAKDCRSSNEEGKTQAKLWI